MNLQRKKSIRELSTFRMGGTVEVLVLMDNKTTLPAIYQYARQLSLPVVHVGECSNTIFTDGVFEAVVVKHATKGISILSQDENSTILEIQSGESWTSLVSWSTEQKFSGLESLAAIPGTAGAAIVQNIGAYGVEIADLCESVEVFNPETSEFLWISARECCFAYRDSIFKETGNNWIVTALRLRVFNNEFPEITDYSKVKDTLSELGYKKPTSKNIEEVITSIRWQKLPNPEKIFNCGSFFKNPILGAQEAQQVLNLFPQAPHWELPGDLVKLSAGWLIEKAGFKGKQINHVGVYENHALVLIHDGLGSFSEIHNLASEITNTVRDMSTITLEREVKYCYELSN